MTEPSPWWSPHIHADRRPRLMLRNRIVAAMRAWFFARDFVEADAAALQVSPGNEAHLHAFATQILRPDGGADPLYLHTSPEFAAKKLLAAGETRLLTIGHVFRNRERGALHHPEFTMAEWYRVGEDYAVLMDDCAAMIRLAAEEAAGATLDAILPSCGEGGPSDGAAVAEGRMGVAQMAPARLRLDDPHPQPLPARGRGAEAAAPHAAVWSFRGRTCDPFAAPERVGVQDAFLRHAGIDLLATMDAEGGTDRDALAAACQGAGIRIADDDTWSDLFSRVLVERVEPELGNGQPTILDRYPSAEAALARPSADDPRVAERFELYVCGVELANGFGELTDPAEQRRRFAAEMAEKSRIYGETYPIDEDLLAALAVMPAASGVALGLDRLIMLACGAPRVEDVIWTPVAG
jgi:lysyl-tRNA synthetase class 2